MTEEYKKLLLSVNKPSRYAGGEFNAANADKRADVRMCLAFADLYEVGMSNIGLRILYHMLNEQDGVVCERCFTPDTDMAEKLRGSCTALKSLESHRDLTRFDILGFSIGFELCYTNILLMLELARIPLRRAERNDEYPLIIAGGPCMVNPEPLADFFDCMLIGDGEECLKKLVEMYKECKKIGMSKEEFLKKAADIDGVYVPWLAAPIYEEGKIAAFTRRVKRSVAKNLDKTYFPTEIIVPNMEIIHDRAVVELQRGCSNGCRFCQACFYYRPMRTRSAKTLFEQAKDLINNTGYDELSLASLSTGDYKELPCLVSALKSDEVTARVKLSLPSLRLSKEIPELSAPGRLGSLTFAPEAGTQRLRDVINKNISECEIDSTLRGAIKRGYKGVKLYFMIGLPTETDEDVAAIADIVHKIKRFAAAERNKSFYVTVSTSVFIPKPLTPFQWEAHASRGDVERKQNMLRGLLKIKNVKYSWHDADSSRIETLLARGDRSLSDVIERAYKAGAVMDSWSEHFNKDAWARAISESGINADGLLGKLDEGEIAPWEIIDNGVTKEYLLKERGLAYEGKTTPPCSESCCGACGANKLGGCYAGN